MTETVIYRGPSGTTISQHAMEVETSPSKVIAHMFDRNGSWKLWSRALRRSGCFALSKINPCVLWALIFSGSLPR